jgi:hypothetical protein
MKIISYVIDCTAAYAGSLAQAEEKRYRRYILERAVGSSPRVGGATLGEVTNDKLYPMD